MQEYNRIEDTEYISDAPSQLNKNMESIATDFSGASFPTENLFVGMKCLRTDENKIYRLYENASNQLVWRLEYTIVDGGIKVKEANHAIQADDLPASKYATQAEAEEGVDNTKVMTPLRTKNAINKQRPLKTYTTFEQLGYSTMPTLETLVSDLPSFTKFVRYLNQSDAETLGLPDYGILEITKAQYVDFASLYLQRGGGKEYIRKAFFENWGRGQNSFQWKQLLASNNIATQAEAEAGTDNTTVMTPLRTAQEIDSKRPIKTYTSLEQLGLDADEATIENICKALPINSLFIADVMRTSWVNFEVPISHDGILTVRSKGLGRIELQFVTSEGDGRTSNFFGLYANWSNPNFSGWNKLATNGALSMPSGNAIGISIPTFTNTSDWAINHLYTAPADGWLNVSIMSTSNECVNETSVRAALGEEFFYLRTKFRNAEDFLDGIIPCRKGQSFYIQTNKYNAVQIKNLVFIYAQSEV